MAGQQGLVGNHQLQVNCLLTRQLPPQVTSRYWLTHIMPVGFFMALSLWAGNAVYLYLTVSFIQMLKVRVWARDVNTATA